MKLSFYKYQGTGNDFIILDNRDGAIRLTTEEVARLCDRRFGIGGDGLMLLEQSESADFHMAYYNADGRQSTMCGNGGRCIAAFARKLGITGDQTAFTAVDGLHTARYAEDDIVTLHMQDVTGITEQEGGLVLYTGSPHYIRWVTDVAHVNVFEEGRSIRRLPTFQPDGINVNFVQRMDQGLWVRTYERGVEDETFSCGTGVTAAAIAASELETGTFQTPIRTPGGMLEVKFRKETPQTAIDVQLIGPATFVFQGVIEL